LFAPQSLDEKETTKAGLQLGFFKEFTLIIFVEEKMNGEFFSLKIPEAFPVVLLFV